MKEFFVDTGAWIAIVDKSDSLHANAQDIYPRLLQADHLLVTTNLVISETYTLLQRRVDNQTALQFLDSIGKSPRLLKVYSGFEIERNARSILVQYRDQSFSYVDAVSFAVMQKRQIPEAFAFDHHFQIAGFALVQ